MSASLSKTGHVNAQQQESISYRGWPAQVGLIRHPGPDLARVRSRGARVASRRVTLGLPQGWRFDA